MDLLCIPAQTFAIIAAVDLVLISLFPKKDRPLITRFKIFVLAIVLIIGWTSVVNKSCTYDNIYLTWGLVVLPTMYMFFRWNR